MEIVGQKILGLKIPEHYCFSDDVISAHGHSDCDILASIVLVKANFFEFLDDDS